MIEVENLVKKYGSNIAVDHLTFHVEKGQIYGFLGPNGAGKSTTMNIMTGYLAATEGSVKINGFDILTQPEEAKKCIGYLPELPPLYLDMTVREYLMFAAGLKKIKKDDRKNQITEIMEMTKIDDVSERLIKNLSKGYKQRVGLAQAILGYPEVIILDEPTVGLDPKQIIEIRDLIRKLGETHTIILSSHILSEVSAICDHIMIISGGKLVASDSPEGLQKLMSGTADLKLTVLSGLEQLQKIISTIPDIREFSCTEGKEDGTADISIETDSQVDIRKEVALALAEQKIPVLYMAREAKSLEDIFLELTGTEQSTTDEVFESDENEDRQEDENNDSNI